MPRVFLTHSPDMLRNYYGERAVAALREVAEVVINPTGHVLDADALIAHGQGCEIVVSDRQTPGRCVLRARARGSSPSCAAPSTFAMSMSRPRAVTASW